MEEEKEEEEEVEVEEEEDVGVVAFDGKTLGEEADRCRNCFDIDDDEKERGCCSCW